MKKRSGIPIVLSAPSGAGKTSVYKRLLKCMPGLVYSISHTTRLPRRGEVNGKDYHFVSPERFKKMATAGDFVEWALVHGNYYGTSKAYIRRAINAGHDVVLDIDVQGAMKLRRSFPEAALIFIMAPSIQEIERRLRHRGKDDEATIRQRLINARREIAYIPRYDYLVINDHLSAAVRRIRSIIEVEHHRVCRVGTDARRFK